MTRETASRTEGLNVERLAEALRFYFGTGSWVFDDDEHSFLEDAEGIAAKYARLGEGERA